MGARYLDQRVKEELVRLGRCKGYKTCTSGVANKTGNTWGEWLYDVVWLKATDNFTVCDVPLVAEIEWGNEGDIWDDFQSSLSPGLESGC